MDGNPDWNEVALALILFLVLGGILYSLTLGQTRRKARRESRRGFEVKLNAGEEPGPREEVNEERS